jgi:hypothetical protein
MSSAPVRNLISVNRSKNRFAYLIVQTKLLDDGHTYVIQRSGRIGSRYKVVTKYDGIPIPMKTEGYPNEEEAFDEVHRYTNKKLKQKNSCYRELEPFEHYVIREGAVHLVVDW